MILKFSHVYYMTLYISIAQQNAKVLIVFIKLKRRQDNNNYITDVYTWFKTHQYKKTGE